jgi:hypothetical protein
VSAEIDRWSINSLLANQHPSSAERVALIKANLLIERRYRAGERDRIIISPNELKDALTINATAW